MNLTELKRVAEAATPGPWIAAKYASSIVGLPVVGQLEGRAICNAYIGGPESDGNARHIATFDPPTVLAMIARIEALEGALEPFVTGAKAKGARND